MNQIDRDFFEQNRPKQADSIEQILLEEEQILVRLKPNRATCIWEALLKGLPFVILWAAIDIFILCLIFGTLGEDDELQGMLFFIIPFFALHLAPVWIYIINVIKTFASVKNIEYVFTDRRIIVRSGLIGIDFKTINYSDVVAVNCKVGLIEKMFKVGDIHIQAKCQTALLNNIPDPYYYLSKLQQIVLDMKADISFPNDLRPGTNHGYRSSYNRDENR